jgi:hypothetical protein
MSTPQVVRPTVWQENASRFAAQPKPQIDQERHAGVRDALEQIRLGRPGYALFKLARSVERQNRIAGGGTISLGVCPSCGRGCVHQDGGAR